MATKKKAKSSKLPAMLDRETVRARQKELRAMAKTGGPSAAKGLEAADDGCVWVPEDVIIITPTGVRVDTRWRKVCS